MQAARQKILVVDDDLRLRDLLKRYLGEQGFIVDTVPDAQAMDRQMARVRYDLLVLDLMLPGEDGLAVCRRLRSARCGASMIMLTAKGDDVDRIVGLEMGADDYLAKPFNPRELVARINAVLRRQAPPLMPGAPSLSADRVSFGPFALDLATRSLTREGAPVPLTTGEFSLLKALAQNAGRPMSRDKLMELARGRELESSDRSIDVQVSRLRRLLGEDPQSPRFIQTVWGFGYVFVADAAVQKDAAVPKCGLFPGSLLARTFVVMVVALVLSQSAALWLFDRYITQPRIAQATRNFVSHLKTVSAAMQVMDAKSQQAFIARVAEQEGIGIHPERSTADLRPVTDRPALSLFRERIRELFGPEAEVYIRDGEAMDAEGRSRVLWVRLPQGESNRHFWVAFPRARVERDPVAAVVAWSVAGLAIALIGTLLILWRLNRPLGELARAAAQLGRGGNPEPVAETGPSEIRGLARAFNEMKLDLRKAERERATFLAGVSHDLRTPLSRMRLDVEMLEGKVPAQVQRGMVEDLDDMNAIIDQFIDFTRSEAAEPLSLVNLSELGRSSAERFARSGVKVRCDLAEIPGLMLRPLAMHRLLDNLIGNAQRHGGGEIVVRTARSEGQVELSVLDRGPGIPANEIERLKQPFTRRDEARSGGSGAGLGLAIANRVAIIHGGRLDLLPRDGGGLEARLTLAANPA